MCVANIPHFKEVVTMSFKCEFFGFKSVELKGMGGMNEKAKKLVCEINDREDLGRDVVKSDWCYVAIPEIELELAPGTLGSMVTTVQGLLEKIHLNLSKQNPFMSRD